MKLNHLFASLLLCGLVMSCNNETEVEQEVTGKTSYVAVQIQASSSGSRALTENTDPGTTEESAVTRAIFFFFDSNEAGCATPCQVSSLTFNTDGKSDAVLVLSNPTLQPAKMVAILNPSDEIYGLPGTTSLAALKAMKGDYGTTSTFTMSNSVYKGVDGNTVDAVPLSATQIAETTEAALLNPVTIPVERVVAKIYAEGVETAPAAETALAASRALLSGITAKDVYMVNNEELEIVTTLKGWRATTLTTETYLIKKIDPTWTGTWWNNLTGTRSSWAISTAPATEAEYGYWSYDEIKDKFDVQYCYENTTTHPTKLIVAAQLTVDGSPLELMEWKGAKYTKTGMTNALVQVTEVKGIYTKTTSGGVDTYTSLTAAALGFTVSEDNQYEVYPTIASGTEFYYFVGDVATAFADVAAVNAELKKVGAIRYWNEGASYFHVNIEHRGNVEGEGEFGQVGIIRNHSYKLTIKEVKGLGTPVPKPNEKIVPPVTPPDPESYIAASVVILPWRIVTQDVVLE
ncbi:MAG: Mfa1 family fimbria major subunit [Phocaeicola sp.]